MKHKHCWHFVKSIEPSYIPKVDFVNDLINKPGAIVFDFGGRWTKAYYKFVCSECGKTKLVEERK